MTAAVARDARPPEQLVRVMNPVMRVVLCTPLGRLVRPFALLEFRGQRSGKLLRVPVGWHATDNGHVVVTPAAWRANFRGGAPVTVRFRCRRRKLIGTLDDDPHAVATTLRNIAERRGSLRPVGIEIPDGHRITPADVAAVDRAVIRFHPTSA